MPEKSKLTALLLLAGGLVALSSPAWADAGPDGGEDAGPPDEMCNGIDDDDDGQTDEDLPVDVPCSNTQTENPNEGECEEGVENCIDGEWVCDANVPMPESCDGLDNDCDAETDENLDYDCFDGVCFNGECVEFCGELLCPEGYVCDWVFGYSSGLCLPDICSPDSTQEFHLACGENPNCCAPSFDPPCVCDLKEQACVDECFWVSCDEDEVCVPRDEGECHPLGESCYVDGCSEGQTCWDGECVTDHCHAVACPDGQYCNLDGDCVDSCVGAICPVGSGCFEGACIDDPCAGVNCKKWHECVDGECVWDSCNPNCEFFEVCRDGACVHNPCWNIDCPDCQMCINGACYEYSEPQSYDPGGDTDADTDSDPVDTDSETDGDAGPTTGMTSVLATGAGGCRCSASSSSVSAGLTGLLFELLAEQRPHFHRHVGAGDNHPPYPFP
jgi:hypothetical protein